MKNLLPNFLLIAFALCSYKIDAQTCNADAGTITVTQTNGTQTILPNGTIQVVLCPGGSFNIVSNNNYTLPPPYPGESSELIYAIYDKDGRSNNDPPTDTNWTGYFWTGQDITTGNSGGLSTNSAGICSPLFAFPFVAGYAPFTPNIIVFVPVTADDGDNSPNQDGVIGVDQNGDSCVAFGSPISVTFLNPVSFNILSNCSNNVSIQINGGYPQFFPVNYTLTNTGAGTLSTTSVASGGSVSISGLTVGQTYSFSVNDGNSCISTFSGIYNTNPSINLNPTSSSICGIGGCVNLLATVQSGVSNGNVTFSNNQCVSIPDGGIGVTNGSPAVVLGNWASSIINVIGSGGTWITGQTLTVCVNISHTFDADLNIYLQAPNGNYVNLSDDNGGAGDNYAGTCFSMSATTAITAGAAPYGGSYIPEGNYSGFNGTQKNGNWILWVGDDAAVGDGGTLLDWSITLSNQNTYTYSWSPSLGLSSTSTLSPTACPTTSTTYTLTVINSIGCTASANSIITVGGGLTINVPPATICNGNSTLLTASGATTYIWSPSMGLSATTGSTVTANPTITTTYTINGNSAGGCGSTTTLITVNPKPTIAVSPISICSGSSGTLTASGASTYSWSPSIGLNQTTGSSVTASPTATTTYTVIGTSSLGCTNNSTVVVTVNALPVITSSSISICQGTSGTLTASGAITYTWSPSTGLNVTTGSSVIANPTLTTTYTIHGTNANGCTKNKIILVTVNPTPILSANSISICSGSSGIINVSGASSYSWSPSTGLSSTSGASVTANPTSNTTYTIVGTSATGCTASVISTVLVNSNTATITANGPITFCGAGSVVLTASTGLTYQWYKNNVLINGATNQNYTAATTASYTVVISSTCGNATSLAIQVIKYTLPTVSISATGSTTICTGTSVVLNSTVSPSTVTYQWYKSTTAINGTTNSTYSATTSGLYALIITNTVNGCTKTSSQIQVTVKSLPTVSITPSGNATICIGDTLTLFAITNTGIQYQWKKNGINISGETNSTYDAMTAGSYRVLVTSIYGCQKQSAQKVISTVTCRNGENADDQMEEISLFPNPTTGTLNISTSIVIKNIECYNSLGQLVFQKEFENEIDLSNYSSGSYLVKLNYSNGKEYKVYKIELTK